MCHQSSRASIRALPTRFHAVVQTASPRGAVPATGNDDAGQHPSYRMVLPFFFHTFGLNSASSQFTSQDANAALQFDQGQVPLMADGADICDRALPIGFTDQLLLRAR